MAFSFSLVILIPLTLGLIQAFILLRDLAKADKIKLQEIIVAFIAKSANFTILTILTLLLCQEQANLSSLEIKVIPIVVGTALLGLNFIRYKTLVISKA